MRFRRRRRAAPVAAETARVVAWGDQLIKVHRWLSGELEKLQTELTDEADRPSLDPVVLARCMSFCDALRAHHHGEDDGMLPHLQAERPELRDVVGRLRHEHMVVAGILNDVRTALAEEPDVTALRGRLAELAAKLAEHFAYEEGQIVRALNSLERVPWESGEIR